MNSMQNKKLTIVKIGSNVLVGNIGEAKEETIANVLRTAKQRQALGEKIILVSSGAVAMGRSVFNDKERKLNKKIAAGVGQMQLLSVYVKVAKNLDVKLLELLLSRAHLIERNYFLQLQETIEAAFEKNIIPIVNENDILVSGTEWSFGDNDSLASALAIALGAQRLIILSNVDGLFTANPDDDPNAKKLEVVEDVNAELMKYCSEEGSNLGSGGMISKLKAARLCTAVGIETVIINGNNKTEIERALAGEQAGTRFVQKTNGLNIKNRERWILAAKNTGASIEIDDGALEALRAGKSLLAVGMKRIWGSFEKGELVEVINKVRESVAIGVVDIGSVELKGLKQAEKRGVQVMHADNLMVFA